MNLKKDLLQQRRDMRLLSEEMRNMLQDRATKRKLAREQAAEEKMKKARELAGAGAKDGIFARVKGIKTSGPNLEKKGSRRLGRQGSSLGSASSADMG